MHRIEVRQEVERESGTCRELRDNPECGQSLELVVSLENPLQVFLGGTNPQVVKDDIAVVVREL